jgi:hypothetical protein
LAGYSIDDGGWREVLFAAVPLTAVAASLTLLLIIRNVYRWTRYSSLRSNMSEGDGSGGRIDNYMPLQDSFNSRGSDISKTTL